MPATNHAGDDTATLRIDLPPALARQLEIVAALAGLSEEDAARVILSRGATVASASPTPTEARAC